MTAVGTLGYAFVEIRPKLDRDREQKKIDITFEVQEGPRVFVERIDITGNVRTRDNVIRREFRLVEGDAFNTAKLRRSRQRIQDLDFFEKVNVDQVPGSAPDKAVVKVAVEEKSTGSLSIGAGFSTGSGFLGDISIRERNFMGRGQDSAGQPAARPVAAAGRPVVHRAVLPWQGDCRRRRRVLRADRPAKRELLRYHHDRRRRPRQLPGDRAPQRRLALHAEADRSDQRAQRRVDLRAGRRRQGVVLRSVALADLRPPRQQDQPQRGLLRQDHHATSPDSAGPPSTSATASTAATTIRSPTSGSPR